MACKSSNVHSLLIVHFLLEITKEKLYYLNHPKGTMIEYQPHISQNTPTKKGKLPMGIEINRCKFLKDFSSIITGTFLAGHATQTSCQVQNKTANGAIIIDPEPWSFF